MLIIEKYNATMQSDKETELLLKQKIRRKVEDYLRKYATIAQLQQLAEMFNIS